ncbi:MAG: methyltransferase domain-containing protein [Nitrososphaerota archaeon]|jgi:SAM-dependent methyltransferase/outer membrane protein assembly factor BamB|nr:methyltransferase domain-containing protein [Nitrososphaerota archaeon]
MDKKTTTPYNVSWRFECESSIINTKCTIGMTRIAIACVDRCLYLLDQHGQELWRKSLDYEAWSVEISQDGSKIAVGTANKKPAAGSIYIFDSAGIELFKHSVDAPVWGLSFMDGNTRQLVATAWNNKVYSITSDVNNEKYDIQEKLIGKYGLYGVKCKNNKIFVNSYQDGMYCLDSKLNILKKVTITDGLYGIDVSDKKANVALRQGKNAIIELDEIFKVQGKVNLKFTDIISTRPICSVAASSDNFLLVSGSFDGIVYLTTESGACLWNFVTDGEIWSVNISEDGSRVFVGSSDKHVYCLDNKCTTSITKEIILLENRLKQTKQYNDVTRLLDIYLSIGIIEYGINIIENIFDSNIDKALIDYLLTKSEHYSISNILLADLCYKYGKRKIDNKYIVKAIEYYQKASKDIKLSFYSLNKAGECFQLLGFETAFQSSFDRANIKFLKDFEKKIIYNLARSYEESGYYNEAKKHYELLLSWDITYRDVLKRCNSVSNKKTHENDLVDYTGYTVNLLGQNFPINVDKSLKNIIRARANELLISEKEREYINDGFILSQKCDYFSNIISKQLAYDTNDYSQYDTLPLEDEVKKTLELINFLSVFSKHKSSIKKSLDIGTATGRYPFILKRLGVETFGIDREKNSINYINQKKKVYGISDDDSPHLNVGDVLELTKFYEKNSFDLITCMMGTFAHFDTDKRHNICRQIHEILKPTGVLVISTWDIECEHLDYLSMYSQKQKELIKNNSLNSREFTELFEFTGFKSFQHIPFAFLPDLFSNQLKINSFTETDARRLMEFDLAAKSLLLSTHGQMYISVFGKN